MQLTKELHKYIISKIESTFDAKEASSIAFIIMEYFGISKQNYVLNDKAEVNISKVDLILLRLMKNEPIQYILEEAWFYDRKFIVYENVLIPRQETEELCLLIIEKNKLSNSIKIIDIGTGSGCIPITLKLEKPIWDVSGLDICGDALKVAQLNSFKMNADVNWINVDIFDDSINLAGFDIVVSNPPYVLNSEKLQMKNNVLDNEPHLALFVDDDNPLLFYKRIVDLCIKYEVKQLFFEINESFGKEVRELMVTKGFQNVCIKQDLQGKDRFVIGFSN